MRYKSGDVVIKTTGGNKMSIFGAVSDGVYKCIWCVDSKMNESLFKEDEIIPISEYRIVEERQYKIDELLKNVKGK